MKLLWFLFVGRGFSDDRKMQTSMLYFFLYFFSLLSFVVLFITWSGGEGYQEDPGYLRVC